MAARRCSSFSRSSSARLASESFFPSSDATNSAYSRSTSRRTFSRTISKKRMRNPPEPLAGSQMISPSCGSTMRIMNSTIDRGVKNWPISPRKVRPRNRSKAMPFTSSLVSERLYRSRSRTISRTVSNFRLIFSSPSKMLSSAYSRLVSSKRFSTGFENLRRSSSRLSAVNRLLRTRPARSRRSMVTFMNKTLAISSKAAAGSRCSRLRMTLWHECSRSANSSSLKVLSRLSSFSISASEASACGMFSISSR